MPVINFWELIRSVFLVAKDFIWAFIKYLWPFWSIFIIFLLFKVLIEICDIKIDNWLRKLKFNQREIWRADRDTIFWLRGMRPSEFEHYIADLFEKLGFKAEVVGGSHDGGIDIIIRKDGNVGYIQCKKFITSEVRVGDVRDFYGSMVDKFAGSKGYFVTTNKFTLEAIKFAEDKPIELIDGFKLIKYIKLAKSAQSNIKK